MQGSLELIQGRRILAGWYRFYFLFIAGHKKSGGHAASAFCFFQMKSAQ